MLGVETELKTGKNGDRDEYGRFALGNPGGPGRPRGSPNSFSGRVRELLWHALGLAGGAEFVAQFAREHPEQFLPIVLKLVPPEREPKKDETEEETEEDREKAPQALLDYIQGLPGEVFYCVRELPEEVFACVQGLPKEKDIRQAAIDHVRRLPKEVLDCIQELSKFESGLRCG